MIIEYIFVSIENSELILADIAVEDFVLIKITNKIYLEDTCIISQSIKYERLCKYF